MLVIENNKRGTIAPPFLFLLLLLFLFLEMRDDVGSFRDYRNVRVVVCFHTGDDRFLYGRNWINEYVLKIFFTQARRIKLDRPEP